MDRDLWAGLSMFVEIVETGSFARAAARLGLSPSALSHAMRALEAKLGTRLLDRTTRSLSPTDSGEQLLQSLRPALASVEEALGVLDVGRDRPAGRVRVNAHRPAAVYVILPRLPRLVEIAPDVDLELVISDGFVDIVAERFDCGVRHEGELQRDMISLRISDPMPLIFVAAPTYLVVHGTPETPDDLGSHRCISYRHTSSGALHRWEFERDGERFARSVPSSFATNDVDVMRDAVLAGLGLACLLRSQVEASLVAGDVIEVLPGWAPLLPANHLYYPSTRQPKAAFRAFVQAMRS